MVDQILRDGVPIRESAGSEKKSVAKKLLKQREGNIVRGCVPSPFGWRVATQVALFVRSRAQLRAQLGTLAARGSQR